MVHQLLGLPPSEQMSWLTKRGQGQLNALQAAAWDEAAPTLMAHLLLNAQQSREQPRPTGGQP